jgi:hypothetical protein
MKNLILIFLASFMGAIAAAQSPQAFKYQAVARDVSGNVLANKTVSIKISILGGSTSGTVLYSETQPGKSTNAFGLLELEIGKGTVLSGTFSSIPWGSNTTFVKVEIDTSGGTTYQAMGTSQLLSIPYALYAKDVQNNDDGDANPTNEIQKLSISGTTISLDQNGGSVTLPSVAGGPFSSSGGITSNNPLTDNFVFGSSKLDDISGTADDSRLFFNKSKGAFRAGMANDNQWNDAYVGNSSVALGNISIARGFASFAMGDGSTASGWASSAFGGGSMAGGNYSFAAGKYAVTTSYASVALGSFNVGQGTADNWVETDPILEVGIGQSGTSKRNALTILKNGNIGIGTKDPEYKLDVSGQLRLTGGSPGNGKVLTSDASGLASWQTPPASDNWGIQYIITDATLSGFGLPSLPLKIADNGVSSLKIADAAVGTADLANNAVTSDKINAGAVTGAKIAQAGATNGQALKWNGSSWAPADDATGGGGLTLPYNGTVTANTAGFRVVNSTNTGIEGVTSSESTSGVRGTSGIATGSGTGVFGECQSTNGGIGVWGVGYTGVAGQTSNVSGTGVYGNSTSATGNNFGVMGQSASNIGAGVYGIATSANGGCFGVFGKSNSSSGYGVIANSPYTGVYGYGTASSGVSYGIYGVSSSSSGIGVYGENLAISGETYGIKGISNSTSGFGVYGYGPVNGIKGEATATTGYTYAIQGKANSDNGCGIYGIASSTTGTTYGVVGKSSSTTAGYGVWGEGLIGTVGKSTFTSGAGIYGFASASSGINYGVWGKVVSPDGYSGFFEGPKFYISGRTGIGTTAPGAGLHLKGSGFPESFMYLEANTGQDAGFRLYEGTTAKWHIFNSAGAGGLQIYNAASATAIFCQQSSSNVGIGTTSPAYKLQVGNFGDGTQARANAWNLLSDARLKRDFSRFTNPLEMIGKLNGYYFYWNTGTDKTRQVGFSAQEVQKTIPEIVSKGEDGYLSVEYSKMAPLLVEAIKALKAENDILRARLEKLEGMYNTHAEK